MSDYLHASIHKFKNNISRYMRALERGDCKAVILYRYDTKIAVVVPVQKPWDKKPPDKPQNFVHPFGTNKKSCYKKNDSQWPE